MAKYMTALANQIMAVEMKIRRFEHQLQVEKEVLHRLKDLKEEVQSKANPD